jgi:hypothetical protein
MERHPALGKHLNAAATSLAGVKQATVDQNDQISTGREAKCGIYNVIRAFRELQTSDLARKKIIRGLCYMTCRAVDQKMTQKLAPVSPCHATSSVT